MQLRLSSWARKRLLVAIPVLLVTMFAVVGLIELVNPTGGGFLALVLTVTAVWAVVVLGNLIHFSAVRYHIDNMVLHKKALLGSDRSAPLAEITAAHPCEITHPMGNQAALQLRVMKVRLTLGTRVARSYYEPEALRAIADGLEQSSDPRAGDVADALRKLAIDKTWRLV